MSEESNETDRSVDGSHRPGSADKSTVPSTRAGRAWVALVPASLILIAVLTFAFQNPGSTRITFLGWHGTASIGLAMLGSALLGGLIVLLFGSVRILQLRRLARRRGRSEAQS